MASKRNRTQNYSRFKRKESKSRRFKEEERILEEYEESVPESLHRRKQAQTVTENKQRFTESDDAEESSSSDGNESSDEDLHSGQHMKELMKELGAFDEEPSDTDSESYGLEDMPSAPNPAGDDVSEVKEGSDDENVQESAEELSLGTTDSGRSSQEETVPKKKMKPLDFAVDPETLPKKDVQQKKMVEEVIKPSDNFCLHFEQDLEEEKISSIADKKKWLSEQCDIPELGKAVYHHPETIPQITPLAEGSTLPSLGLRTRLFNLIGRTLKQQCKVQQVGDCEPTMSASQYQLFHLLNGYKDLYFPNLKWADMEHFRMVYCLHALNHVLKTRLRVTLNSAEKWAKPIKQQDPNKEYRDQGLTRPKVLILLPFKSSAFHVVNMFESLLMTKKKSLVTGKKRFIEEFSPEEDSAINPKKPDDYIRMFSGNTDDCFRLGIKLGKSGMKLYADFYKADILVCSPLGLRLILGAEGDAARDFDFMSSIEILILDQADVFLMQNWEHILHAMNMLHVQPKETRDTDFSRIRMWTLNGHSKYYRQTVVFSAVHSPELSALFSKHCNNFAGEVRVQPEETNGSVCLVATQMPLFFQRFLSTSVASAADDRFNYFINDILPQYLGKEKAGTLIFIPSYYDYIRLRNHLKKQAIETSLVCEYASDKAIRRAKKMFYTKETQFMLYTERIHFFRRMLIRKIRHLIFYALPTYPHFFSDMCNLCKTSSQSDLSCLVLFSKLDAYKMAACVGKNRAVHMTTGEKSVYMLVTGDAS